MTNDEKKIMFNLVDMLKGEINRMCVTDDLSELDTMSSYANENIKKLKAMRYKDIKQDR